MSLSLALNNAISGLNINQSVLGVISQNIANANTEGYSRQVVEQGALYTEGVGSGVSLEAINRKIDSFMITARRSQGAEVAKGAVIADYLERLQLSFGQPNLGADLAAYVDNFFNAAQDLADSPDRASTRQAFVGNAVILADQISTLARNMETLRYEADRDLDDALTLVNTQTQILYDLNHSLNLAYANGNSTAGLLDQRDLALQKIAEMVDIQTNFSPSGAANVSIAGGLSLLTETRYKMEYIPATSLAQVINGTQFRDVSLVPVDEDGVARGKAIEIVAPSVVGELDTKVRAGKMRGLLELRDIEIPKILAELDEFAETLRDEVNAIHNDGAGFPPPTTLLGTRPVTINDARDWQGTMQIAVLNNRGEPIPSPYASEDETNGIRPLVLDLEGLDIGNGVAGRWTTEDVMDELNAHFGTPQKKIHLNGLNDIRLVSMTENDPAGTGFSFDFDLENISANDVDLDITAISFSAGALVGGLPNTQTVHAGDWGRTGTEFSFDANLAGLCTISIDVQVTNSLDGSIETATIEFTVDPSVLEQKNDRYLGTVTAGTATEELPIDFSRFLTASLVDAEGNAVTTDDTEGFLQLTAGDGDLAIAIDELDSKEYGQLSDTPPLLGTDRGFSFYYELNNFFVRHDTTAGSAYTMAVREDIARNPNFVATGELVASYQPANPTTPYYTYQLGAGNNAVVQRIASLSAQQVGFDAAGSLPSTSDTLSSYASTIVGAATAKTLEIQQLHDHASLILQGYEERANAASGVNLDEELANTVIYQNAYAASARIITVTDELYTTLLQAF